MDFENRRAWLFAKTKSSAVKRIRLRGETREQSRSCSIAYFFSNDNGDDIKVCQKFFLSTLGYSSNTVIKTPFSTMTRTKTQPAQSKWGKHSPNHKMSEETIETIKAHTNLINPAISHHYRREHAPMLIFFSC